MTNVKSANMENTAGKSATLFPNILSRQIIKLNPQCQIYSFLLKPDFLYLPYFAHWLFGRKFFEGREQHVTDVLFLFWRILLFLLRILPRKNEYSPFEQMGNLSLTVDGAYNHCLQSIKYVIFVLQPLDRQWFFWQNCKMSVLVYWSWSSSQREAVIFWHHCWMSSIFISIFKRWTCLSALMLQLWQDSSVTVWLR